MRILTIFLGLVVLMGCTSGARPSESGGNKVRWVQNLEEVYPSSEWVAVIGQGSSRNTAENAAMNALARSFKTDLASLTQTNQRMSQIVNEAQGKKSVSFDQSQDFLQEVSVSSNIQGLIGVQVDVYEAPDGTVYANARMHRRECAARYSGLIRENVAVINRLLASATGQGTMESYAYLSYAYAIAQVTGNFQNILEVLDSSAVNRRPAYGGANAIRTKMLECAALITIGIDITTETASEKTLLTRAAGSFFRDQGFKINEQGRGNYTLRSNIRFEELRQAVISCRYYMDAVLENQNRAALFSFTEDDRQAHVNSSSEARRLAVRALETSLKEGRFAQEFNGWLNTLLD